MAPVLMSLLLVGLAVAGPRPADPVLQRLSPVLRQALASPDPGTVETVVLSLRPEASPDSVGRRAAALPGVRLGPVVRGLVQLEAPRSALGDLAMLPGVRRVRRPHRASGKDVVSEGVAEMGVEDWASDHGLTGAGIRIAVLDTGFRGYTDWLGSELPAAPEVDFLSDVDDSDHGTDVAQIVHDLAPDADLLYVTFDTQAEFVEATERIAAWGPDVINASVGFDNIWHADGTSFATRAVDLLVADSGATYVAAAGNEADNYVVSHTITDEDGDGWLELDGEEDIRVWTSWDEDSEVDVSLRWSEPFGEAGIDLDLYIFDVEWTRCGRSTEYQDGDGDPYERVECFSEVESETAWVSVKAYTPEGGDPPDVSDLSIWLYSRESFPHDIRTNTQCLTLPGDAELAVSVAAWDVEDDALASYSSRGPTDDGRHKPELAAPTSVRTATDDSFNGTSAAAPHVTGVAALALQASRAEDEGLDREGLEAWLLGNCTDRGPAGTDLAWGAGILQPAGPPGLEPGEVDSGAPTGVGDSGDTGDAHGGDAPGGTEGAKGAAEPDAGGCSTAPLGASPLIAALVLIRRRRQA